MTQRMRPTRCRIVDEHQNTLLACHTTCVRAYAPSPALRVCLLRVLEYWHDPLASYTTHRMRWLCSQWSSTPILKLAKPNLPLELRMQIATYYLQDTFLQRYVMTYAPALLNNLKSHGHLSTSPLRVSVDIWAHFIYFEGIRYISSLSNSHDDYHTESFSTPCPSKPINSIYIAENHLGVMQVIFGTSIQVPLVNTRQDCWWRIVSLRGRSDPVIETYSDVSTPHTPLVPELPHNTKLTCFRALNYVDLVLKI